MRTPEQSSVYTRYPSVRELIGLSFFDGVVGGVYLVAIVTIAAAVATDAGPPQRAVILLAADILAWSLVLPAWEQSARRRSQGGGEGGARVHDGVLLSNAELRRVAGTSEDPLVRRIVAMERALVGLRERRESAGRWGALVGALMALIAIWWG